ncbi:MAG: phosphodiester glycosidase family protein [Verrucomicrobiae bacterium]|nr:phosphodiester glycosidase family protein [Verrucomicrobiae bacterium]
MKCVFCPLFIFAVLASGLRASGEVSATNEVVPGIFIHAETRTNPPTHLFVAEVDLKNPKLHLRVSRGGPDPDGPGIWQTTLLEPTKIAGREKFDFVVNGDFFIAKGVNDGEGTNAAFRAAQWARMEGPAMTDGETWSIGTNARPALVVHKNHAVTIELLKQPAADDWEVIGGNVMLVKDGAIVSHKSTARHPRTVAGLDATGGKLILLLVDGRKPGVAIGMTYDEEAAEMLRLGCRQAFNLDGGGSSVMAVRAAGQLKILNEPTDGRERSVGNVLGISVDQN